MIVALKPGVTKENREQLMDWLQNLGLHIHLSLIHISEPTRLCVIS